MSDSTNLAIYVDAPAPLGHALQKVFEILSISAIKLRAEAKEDGDKGQCGNEGEKFYREKLNAAREDKSGVIVQYVSMQDFESAQSNYFKVGGNDRNVESLHPLKHRFTFDECKEKLGKGGADEEVSKEYARKTRPIIYCFDFDFIKYQDDKNNDNIFFLDSSIWQRAVSLNAPTFFADLDKVIKYFSNNSKYWDRAVTLETLEYQTRMFKEMHLAPFGVTGHGVALNLSSWASETKASRDDSNGENIKIFLPRRFLLIDDFSRKPLRKFGKEPNENNTLSSEVKPIKSAPTCLSKGQRIYELLGNLVDKCEFDTVQTLEGAKEAVRNKAYDIVFLDYVLDGSGQKRETGLQFLRYLNNDVSSVDVQKSVTEKLWVFPVSSFAEAFIGDMLNGDVQLVNPNFNWSCGADPIRQPTLFRGELQTFLQRQDEKVKGIAGGLKYLSLTCKLKTSDYENCHRYTTLHQDALEPLFALSKSSLLVGQEFNAAFSGKAPQSIGFVVDYLENYLRSRRYYKRTAAAACMRDLQCIISLSKKRNDRFWVEWARNEMTNLLPNL